MFTNPSYKAHVYPPSEDSFLLLDAIADDKTFIQERCGGGGGGGSGGGGGLGTVVEIGVGSGYVLSGVGQVFGTDEGTEYTGVDINPVALEATQTTWAASGLDPSHLHLVLGDAADALEPEFRADLILFNPPYVPTPPEEVGSDGIAASWAGGDRGRQVLDRVLPSILSLLSPHGVFYLLLLAENDPDQVSSLLTDQGFSVSSIASTTAGPESLSIHRIHRPTPPMP